MSVIGGTGLPFQNDLLIASKSRQTSLSGKQPRNANVDYRIQTLSQSYQQRNSIFQLENSKEHILQDGYNAKLADQRWAQANYEYEKTNVGRLNDSNRVLEESVAQANASIKEYEAKIKSTNVQVAEIDKNMETVTEQIKKIEETFAKEVKAKDTAKVAKDDYEQALNKDKILNKELKDIDSEKNKSTSNITTYKQRKTDVGNAISSLKAKKSGISQNIASLTGRKFSVGAAIGSIQARLEELRAQKASSAVVSTGKGSVEAAPNASVAIDTSEIIEGNNGAAAALGEVQNSNSIEAELLAQPSEEILLEEETQISIDEAIEAEILKLEGELEAKLTEQDEIDKEIDAQTKAEADVDKEITAKEEEEIKIDEDIENEEIILADLDDKYNLKQIEIEDNKIVIEDKLVIFNEAKNAIDPATAESKNLQEDYNKLIETLEALKVKRGDSDSGLKQLKNMKNYFDALLEGQGNAKVGAKAELEVAQEKEAKAYEILQNKINILTDNQLNLFIQKDITNKAKSDMNVVKLELENANIFSTIG